MFIEGGFMGPLNKMDSRLRGNDKERRGKDGQIMVGQI